MTADSDGSIAKRARNAARLLDGSELGHIVFESTNDRSKVRLAAMPSIAPSGDCTHKGGLKYSEQRHTFAFLICTACCCL